MKIKGKTCPRCSHVTNLGTCKSKGGRQESVASHKSLPFRLHLGGGVTKVQCSQCELVWCFQCHAPWHDGITCVEFRKGDRMLRYWAKEVNWQDFFFWLKNWKNINCLNLQWHYGQQNAQLCPKCKIYIQRTKGCDHMVCTFCETDFCYKCGCKFRSLKFIGE